MNMEMSKVWSEMGDYYKHFEISICINKPSLTIFALPPKVNISFYSGKIKMTKKKKQKNKKCSARSSGAEQTIKIQDLNYFYGQRNVPSTFIFSYLIVQEKESIL